jgi:hypothetical protein
MTHAFEYGDALLPEDGGGTTMDEELSNEETKASTIGSNQPYLNLATSVTHLD